MPHPLSHQVLNGMEPVCVQAMVFLHQAQQPFPGILCLILKFFSLLFHVKLLLLLIAPAVRLSPPFRKLRAIEVHRYYRRCPIQRFVAFAILVGADSCQ